MAAKKIKGLVISVLVIAAVAYGIFHYKKNQAPVLRVCSWSSYFPDSTLEKFTAKTGIHIEMSYISSNEELLAKLKAGATGFDVIQPSDYMVRLMSKQKMLAPIDSTRLSNIKHLGKEYFKLAYDPGLKHSIPFSWGTTGLTINTKYVKNTEKPTWKWLFESTLPKQTAFMDDMREVFAASAFYLKMDANTKDPQKLQTLKNLIQETKSKILLFAQEPRPLLMQEEIYIGHTFSTDGIQAERENGHLKYVLPEEGAVIWTDNLAIPATSNNIQMAHQFIDHFLEPEIAATVAKEKWVSTPNASAYKLLPKHIQEDKNLYPDEATKKKLLFLDDLQDTLPVISQMWTEIKS